MNRGIDTSIIIVLQLIFFPFLNIFRTDGGFITEPTVFLLLSSLVLLANFLYYKKPIVLNSADRLSLGLVFFLVIKNIISNNIDPTTISYLLLLSLLYLSFKKLTSSLGKYRVNHIYLLSFSLLLFLTFAIYHCYVKKEKLDSFYFPNKTIFGIVIASQLCFLLPYFKLQFTTNKILKYTVLAIFCCSVVLLVATNSRSACLGMLVALAFVINKRVKIIKSKYYLSTIIIFVLLILGLFFYKPNSSSGRLLIYKISAQIFKDNWLWGIGTGKFKVVYNQYQAQYFANHSIDSKAALLADNTYYAFNEYYQLVIENGIIAVVFLIIFVLLLYKQAKKIAASNNILATSAISSAICILTASLFSYPLQFLPLMVQLLFCLAIINTMEHDKKENNTRKYVNSILVALCLFSLAHYTLYYKYQMQAKEASSLSQAGFKTKALGKYAELKRYYFIDGNTLYQYTKELYYTNRIKEAKETIEVAKTKFTSHGLIKLSALINLELQDYMEAEKQYKHAIHMVPNRMQSRKELLDFYLFQKDTINAISWAKSIINMPIKVPSSTTELTLKQTKEILAKIQ